VGGGVSTEPSWWEHDARGIPLCRVCTDCRTEKLGRYRPEILTGYSQQDVDEPIEAEDGDVLGFEDREGGYDSDYADE
jgi:hypothetical protein